MSDSKDFEPRVGELLGDDPGAGEDLTAFADALVDRYERFTLSETATDDWPGGLDRWTEPSAAERFLDRFGMIRPEGYWRLQDPEMEAVGLPPDGDEPERPEAAVSPADDAPELESPKKP